MGVCLLAILIGMLVSMPHILHSLDERYEGVAIHLNSDEHLYLARTQEVLTLGANRLGNAIGGGDLLPALQTGLIEQFYGTLFRSFVSRASSILIFADFIIPVFLFLVIVAIARFSDLSRKRSLLVAVIFSSVELYNLGRPIHQKSSFLLVLLSMLLLILGSEKSYFWSILAGILLGILFSIYFWSWTAAWCFYALLLLWFLILKDWKKCKRLLVAGLTGVFVASFELIRMVNVSSLPEYKDVYFRSGIANSRIPESWIWSVIFLILALGSLWHLWKKPKQKPYIPIIIISAFILLNQHAIHGVRFLFASHYLFSLVFSSVLALVFFWKKKSLLSIFAFLSALIFIMGIAYDNRSLISQWRVDSGDFFEQHLASTIPHLHLLERGMVLSDPDTSAFIASNTKHDVSSAVYKQHGGRTHEEITERFCLTQFPINPNNRTYKDRKLIVYGAAYDALDEGIERNSAREQELKLVDETCANIDESPNQFFNNYKINYVLHNKKRNPEWNINRISIPLLIIEETDDWVLYKVPFDSTQAKQNEGL